MRLRFVRLPKVPSGNTRVLVVLSDLVIINIEFKFWTSVELVAVFI